MDRKIELLKRVLDELSIINHSDGISGFHLNGDIEPWSRTEFPNLMEEIEIELNQPLNDPV